MQEDQDHVSHLLIKFACPNVLPQRALFLKRLRTLTFILPSSHIKVTVYGDEHVLCGKMTLVNEYITE